MNNIERSKQTKFYLNRDKAPIEIKEGYLLNMAGDWYRYTNGNLEPTNTVTEEVKRLWRCWDMLWDDWYLHKTTVHAGHARMMEFNEFLTEEGVKP